MKHLEAIKDGCSEASLYFSVNLLYNKFTKVILVIIVHYVSENTSVCKMLYRNLPLESI